MASSSSNRMARKDAIKVTPSTGNVFRDIGFSREESERLLIRADLLIQIRKTIKSKRLKRANVATVLRVTQPRVNDLLRGRIDLFTTDSLIDMLARLGVGVRLVVKAPVKPTRPRTWGLPTKAVKPKA
jgi:predicted XRE-type DNA-binding protein